MRVVAHGFGAGVYFANTGITTTTTTTATTTTTTTTTNNNNNDNKHNNIGCNGAGRRVATVRFRIQGFSVLVSFARTPREAMQVSDVSYASGRNTP